MPPKLVPYSGTLPMDKFKTYATLSVRYNCNPIRYRMALSKNPVLLGVPLVVFSLIETGKLSRR